MAADCDRFPLSRYRLPTRGADLKVSDPDQSGLSSGDHRAEEGWNHRGGRRDRRLAVSSVAFADTSTGNLKNDCAFGNEGGAPAASAIGGSSLLGLVGALTSAATDASTQANTANCTNVQLKDLIDTDSNNKSHTTTTTMIKDSNNTED